MKEEGNEEEKTRKKKHTHKENQPIHTSKRKERQSKEENKVNRRKGRKRERAMYFN